MKLLKENISLLSSLISIITVIVGWVCNSSANSFTLAMSILTIVLLVFVFIVDQKRFKAENKNKALQVLAKEKRVFSLNYILLFEYLQSKNKKTLKPSISYSKFKYHIHNVHNKKTADNEYEHEFGLKSHSGTFDPLIMYAVGELVEKEIYCLYNGKKIDPMQINDEQVRISNRNNNRISHFQFEFEKGEHRSFCLVNNLLIKLKKIFKIQSNIADDKLELHYYNKGGHFMSDNDVFTIFPQNYGKTFSCNASFRLEYDQVNHPFSVSLYKLPYNKGEYQIKPYKVFQRNNEGTVYTCEVDSLDVNSIYFITIEKFK